MEPSTTYHFEVCAHFITEEGDVACSGADSSTGNLQSPEQSSRPPSPRIIEHHEGPTFIGVKWDAGYDYDSYFVNYSLKGQGPKTIHHDDDGTWGYQRIDGLLPSRTYILQVQGCEETLLGIGDDRCRDWSAPVEIATHAYPQHSGVEKICARVSSGGKRLRVTMSASRRSGATKSRPITCRLRVAASLFARRKC